MADHTENRSGAQTPSGENTIVKIIKYLTKLAEEVPKITPWGAVTHYFTITKSLAGNALNVTGAITKKVLSLHTYAGSISFAGAYSYLQGYLNQYTASASLAITGAITRLINNLTRVKSGVLSIAGVVTNTAKGINTLSLNGAITILKVIKYLSNQTSNVLSFSGSVESGEGEGTQRHPSGTLSLSGAITHLINLLTRGKDGVLSFSGDLRNRLNDEVNYYAETLSGTLSTVGEIYEIWIITEYTKTKSRTIRMWGGISSLLKKFYRIPTGTLSLAAELSYIINGYVPRQFNRTCAGVLSFTGSLVSGLIAKAKFGVLTLDATVSRGLCLLSKGVSGALSFAGTVFATDITPATFQKGWLSLSGSLSSLLHQWYYEGSVSMAGTLQRKISISRKQTGSMTPTSADEEIEACIEIFYYGIVNP